MTAGGFILGGGQIGGRQLIRIVLPILCRFLVPICRRKGMPDICFPIILRNALTVFIRHTEIELRCSDSLLGRAARARIIRTSRKLSRFFRVRARKD